MSSVTGLNSPTHTNSTSTKLESLTPVFLAEHDTIHTDRSKQYMFHNKEDLMKNKNVQKAVDIEKSIGAHEKLESYVKKGRLYYAMFNSKSRDEDGYIEPEYVHAFAVGISRSTGNLVGMLSMVPSMRDLEPIFDNDDERGKVDKGGLIFERPEKPT